MQKIQSSFSPAFPPIIAASAIAAAFVLASGMVSAQTILTSTNSQGSASFSNRAETADAEIKRDAADAMLREQRTNAMARGDGQISVARSQAIDRHEAGRRLRLAEREFARGPDMQQGIPPIAERASGERRRERVESLARRVAEAQARIRELEGSGAVARRDVKAGPLVALR